VEPFVAFTEQSALQIGGTIFRVVEPFLFSAYCFQVQVQPLVQQIGKTQKRYF